MPERMITQYQRWVFDKEKKENVENLRSFVIQEAEFQMAATETIHGLHRIGNKAKIDHTYFSSSQQSNKGKYQKKCVFCNLDHSLWDCVQFKQLDIRQRCDVARSNKLCYRCLRRSHYGEACTKMGICGINGCKESHNRLLHRGKFVRRNNKKDEKKKEKTSITEGEQAKSNERSHTTTMHAAKQTKVADEFVFRTVLVTLKNGNRSFIVNSLLDDGSTKPYVNSDVAAELNLKGTLERVNISVLNGRSESLETMPVEFGLESIDGKVDIKFHTFTADRVTGNMKAFNWRSFANKWNHLKGIAFPIIGARPIIDILIGIDYANLHCSIQERKGKPGKPIARLTLLGWTCTGKINGLLQRSVQTNFIKTYKTMEIELQEINSTLAKFWEIQSVADNMGRIMNEDDKDMLDLVSKPLRYENGKYQFQIPWKKERLDNTARRLTKQPEFGEKYCEIIKQYIKKGYLEYVDVKDDSNDCWYLPPFSSSTAR